MPLKTTGNTILRSVYVCVLSNYPIAGAVMDIVFVVWQHCERALPTTPWSASPYWFVNNTRKVLPPATGGGARQRSTANTRLHVAAVTVRPVIRNRVVFAWNSMEIGGFGVKRVSPMGGAPGGVVLWWICGGFLWNISGDLETCFVRGFWPHLDRKTR